MSGWDERWSQSIPTAPWYQALANSSEPPSPRTTRIDLKNKEFLRPCWVESIRQHLQFIIAAFLKIKYEFFRSGFSYCCRSHKSSWLLGCTNSLTSPAESVIAICSKRFVYYIKTNLLFHWLRQPDISTVKDWLHYPQHLDIVQLHWCMWSRSFWCGWTQKSVQQWTSGTLLQPREG